MFSWRGTRRRVLIVGHRGASAIAPENTLASFRAAVREGANAVELDVRLTADGRVVVLHDSTLLRTAGIRRKISGMKYRDLRDVDAGRWFGPEFEGERIPLLSEVLELLPSTVGINIELKRLDDRHSRKDIVSRCAGIIRETGSSDRVLLSSFHVPYLRLARKELPHTPRGLLYHTILHAGRNPISMLKRLEACYLILFHRTVRRKLLLEANLNGYQVGEYTIDTAERLRRSLRNGIHAVISNDPGRIVRLMASR
jgi:glycerophosphoryl diester phosphodiesterase